MRRLRFAALRWIVGVATTGLVSGCGASSSAPVGAVSDDGSGYTATALSPPVERPALTLRDTDGKLFDLLNRPDHELTVLFFGYTHCPDVCPTTMADVAAAKRKLSSRIQARLEVVFVTEDPARDTPAVLRDWLDRFDDEFVGLIGGGARTAAALRELHLPQTVLPTPTAAGLTPSVRVDVEHSGIVYVFGSKVTLLYTGGATPAQYASDLNRLAGS